MQLVRGDAVGQPQRDEAEALGARPRHDLEARVRAQERNLPANPQSPPTWFAIRHALEVRAQELARGGEHLLRGVERHAPDEMHVRRHPVASTILPDEVGMTQPRAPGLLLLPPRRTPPLAARAPRRAARRATSRLPTAWRRCNSSPDQVMRPFAGLRHTS